MKIRHFLRGLAIAYWMLSITPCRAVDTIVINNNPWKVDTLEHYQVGPGVMYTKFQITRSTSLRTLYVLETDMTNPYNKIEEWQSQGEVGTFQLLTDAHQQMSYANHRPIGSVNCNFWCGTPNIEVDPTLAGCEGQCLSGTARNGWLIGEPMFNWNRGYPGDDPKQSVGFVMITKEKRAFIEDMWYDGYMTIQSSHHAIRDCNRTRTNPNEDEIALFNEYIGSKSTRSTDGIEVVFQPDEWNINEDMHCTVVSVNNHGGTRIQSGQGVLQGRGSGQTFLQPLQVGDTFCIHLDIFSQTDSIRPHITQMMTGNALVMKHGQLMPRNTTEGYCNMDYPRAMFATNETGDRFWMMISEKPGMKTAELCAILQVMGATYAAGADGGGSAQMNLFGQIQNPTTENTPRRLPNSMFVVSTAPDSEDAGKMEFLSPLASIPAYASYTPTLRAWTAEGAFISHDYKKHTLSCEPETLGTISADGLTFTANPVNGKGLLVATYGSTRAETPIEIKDGQVQIILDSIVLGNRDYEIEVEAIAGNISLPMSPKALNWSVLEETNAPCSVNEDGILHGEQNGETMVVGSLSQFSDTLKVKVELAHAPQYSTLYPLPSTPLPTTPLPKDTSFAFSSTRNASITLPIPMRLWGNPDSILVVINTSSPVQSMEMTCRAANAKQAVAYKLSGTTEPNVDYTFHFAVDKVIEDHSRGIYPLYLESLKCGMKDPTKNKVYTLTIKDIILCYRDWAEVTDLESLSASLPYSLSAQKIMVNGQLYILKNNKIYTIHGNESK